jgi:hypothetical protein
LPLRSAAARVLAHPGVFALRVLKAFRSNQGLLLAGAVAYYALLSLVPLLILVMIVLSHAIDSERLLSALTEYLAFVVPGSSDALVDELRRFVEHRHVIGGVLLVTLVFFSAPRSPCWERDVVTSPPRRDPPAALPGLALIPYCSCRSHRFPGHHRVGALESLAT